MTSVKLFCFPYAGGASSAYNPWKLHINPGIELRAIELAARGRRMREPNYQSIDHAVDDVFNVIKSEIQQAPYALFGHSMGSMIAFELANKIRDFGLPGPAHIFFSGRAAPHISRENKRKLHHLPEEEFKKEMMAMGGTPKEFFEMPELMEVFLPLLKGDFRLTETYTHTKKDSPLDCAVTVFSGKQDEDTIDEVEAWKVHTRLDCKIHYYEGGHFFIHDDTKEILDIINGTLSRA